MVGEPIAFEPVSTNIPQESLTPRAISNDWTLRLINQGLRINKSSQVSTSGSAIIYEVPANKVFYLTSASLSVTTLVAGALWSIGTMRANSKNDEYILSVQSPKGVEGANESAVAYSIPLKFNQGENIDLLGNNGSAISIGAIGGYELGADVDLSLLG